MANTFDDSWVHGRERLSAYSPRDGRPFSGFTESDTGATSPHGEERVDRKNTRRSACHKDFEPAADDRGFIHLQERERVMEAILSKSNDERINQDFIDLSDPTDPPTGAFKYPYSGFFGCESVCTLEIIGNVVICSERDDNEGTSITNMAEHLATRVCYNFGIRAADLVWIEHYEDQPLTPYIREDHWSYVRFTYSTGDDEVERFFDPKWRHVTPDDVKWFKRAGSWNMNLAEKIEELEKGGG